MSQRIYTIYFYVMAKNGRWNVLFKNAYICGKAVKKNKKMIDTKESFGRQKGVHR